MKYLTQVPLVIFVGCVLFNGNAKSLNTFGSIIKYIAGSDERQSCPQVDCAGKASCSSSSNCVSPQRCCIDLVNSRACCSNTATPAPPTSPAPGSTAAPVTSGPATQPPASSAAPSSAAPTPAAASTAAPPPPVAFCPDLQPPSSCVVAATTAATPAAAPPNTCQCEYQQDCFESETCCIGPNGLGCYLKVSPTTTTTRKPGLPCPSSVISAPCVEQPTTTPAGLFLRQAVDLCGTDKPCGSGQICCKKDRALPSCCITYP